MLQAVCKANSVDCGKITMIQVDPAAKVVTAVEASGSPLPARVQEALGELDFSSLGGEHRN